MQDTKPRIYEKPDLNAQMREGDVEWAGKYQNVYFWRTGQTSYGHKLYPSIAAAKAHVQKWLADPAQWSLGNDGISRHMSDYSHTIQLPVKEQ